jgi:hypothetical protein
VKIANDSVKLEINEEGTVTGEWWNPVLHTRKHIDGTSSWNGKFIQMTERGDMIVSAGSGTAVPSTTKGIIEITGEVEIWTQSLKLT